MQSAMEEVPAARSTPQPTLRLLLIEDNVADARLFREVLLEASGVAPSITHVASLETTLEALEGRSFDVAMVDLSLPDASGLQSVSVLHARAPDLPMVVMTHLEDEVVALECVHEGAQDYLIKGKFTSEILVRSIRYAMERHRIIWKLQQSQHEQLRLKDNLLSDVSHELRTPLAAVQEFVMILLDGIAGEVNDRQRRYLQIALRNIEELRAMVRDLLDASRAEWGQLSMVPRATQVGELIPDILNTFANDAAVGRIQVSISIPADLPLVYADPHRVRQVLTNLVGNAIKFTPPEGHVKIQATKSDEPGFVTMSVSDTGPGIPTEDLDLVFDRLFQGSAIAQRNRKGFGLGLYIASELVTLHGGRIWATSRLGAGSEFNFTLPEFRDNPPARAGFEDVAPEPPFISEENDG